MDLKLKKEKELLANAKLEKFQEAFFSKFEDKCKFLNFWSIFSST